jgi:hypothetical protein
VEEDTESASGEEARSAVPDVHPRDSEMNDEVLRDVRRSERERQAADRSPQRGPGANPRR